MTALYPAGVTGLEPQIIGARELDEFREVDNCDYVGDYYIRPLTDRYDRPTRRVQSTFCTFEGGEVPGVLVRTSPWEGTFYWECPICHRDNETTVDLDDEADL